MRQISKLISIFLATGMIASCSPEKQTTHTAGEKTTQDVFFSSLTALCGNGYNGKMASDDEADADMAGLPMQMKVGPCSESEIRIPFHVGEARSRTWVITRTESGLRLKHRHAHEDGTADTVSQYGGDTADMGTATRQNFPVDQFSIDLFIREGLDVSITNVWTVEKTAEIFAYELNRENRHFRVEFDLTNPVENVPDPW